MCLQSPQNPPKASTLPYDILNNIFTHCLPHAPLDVGQVQPNTKIAPMLLCHVCSSWRNTALASPSLWTHIYVRLPIQWVIGENPIVLNVKTFQSALECLKWWRENHGSIAPFIKLEIHNHLSKSTQDVAEWRETLASVLNDPDQLPVQPQQEYIESLTMADVRSRIVAFLARDMGRRTIVWSEGAPNTSFRVLDETGFSQDPAITPGFAVHDDHERHHLPDDTMKFFIEYLSSAHYLDVGFFAQYLFIKQDGDKGYEVGLSNLHTLVARFSEEARFFEEEGDAFSNRSHTSIPPLEKVFAINIPTLPTQTLRRLSVHGHGGELLQYSDNNWSRLTHLSLRDVVLLPQVWFSIIRAALDLQWGYFKISITMEDASDITPPPQSTLPCLSTLSVDVDIVQDFIVMTHDFPLSLLFLNLQLPALKNLSIRSKTREWPTPRAIKEVNTVLRSAPAVTRLALGPLFLSDVHRNSSNFWELAMQGATEPPLSVLAPLLTHLELDLCCVKHGRTTLSEHLVIWQEIFFTPRWLDLANPANTVRTMSIFVNPAGARHALEAALGEYVKKADNVRFEIFTEDTRETSPDGWKTWD